MDIKDFFSKVREDVSKEQFDNLAGLIVHKPEYFNWVMDIFYDLNVKKHPSSTALIWRHYAEEKRYTFEGIYGAANQFLNFPAQTRHSKRQLHLYPTAPRPSQLDQYPVGHQRWTDPHSGGHQFD